MYIYITIYNYIELAVLIRMHDMRPFAFSGLNKKIRTLRPTYKRSYRLHLGGFPVTFPIPNLGPYLGLPKID
jgi:hypothetical protein